MAASCLPCAFCVLLLFVSVALCGFVFGVCALRFPPFVVGLFSTPCLSTPRAGAPLNVCALAGRLICATLLHNQQRKAQTLLGVVSPQVSYLGSSQHFLPTGRCTSVCVCPCSSKIVLFPGMMRAAGPLPRRRATLLHKFPWTLSPRPGARWVRRPVRLAPPPNEHCGADQWVLLFFHSAWLHR